MEPNLSNNNRLFLIAAGLATLAMALVGPRTIWGLLGLIPLLSGMTAGGPMFRIFGLSARPLSSGQRHGRGPSSRL